MQGCPDAKGAASRALERLVGSGIKIEILIEPPDVLITGRSWLAWGILARHPPDIPSHACDAPAEPILLAAGKARHAQELPKIHS